ncbi:hypothetical protein HP15_2148 [Marinobacter adhaerens HP15]|uniref:Uncharacterized protein n=1 Tax=Marinobacter adhaerens (strain DSM 23420 / HP15) TaxID=225937 RepID=E4PF32_MARAH|nr:hypothetical protein HP15_2148 [Marinobacter adhaerens HP15]
MHGREGGINRSAGLYVARHIVKDDFRGWHAGDPIVNSFGLLPGASLNKAGLSRHQCDENCGTASLAKQASDPVPGGHVLSLGDR